MPGATLPAQRNCRRDETRGNSHTQKRKHEEEQRHEQRSGKLLRVLKIGQQQATHPARGLNHTRRSNKLSAAVANNQPLSRVTVRQSPAHVWSHKSAPSKSSKHQPNSRHCQRPLHSRTERTHEFLPARNQVPKIKPSPNQLRTNHEHFQSIEHPNEVGTQATTTTTTTTTTMTTTPNERTNERTKDKRTNGERTKNERRRRTNEV
mgnify:CR=1 FL=1